MKRFFFLLAIMFFLFTSCSLEEDYNVYDNEYAIKVNEDKYFQQKSTGNNYGNVYSQNVSGTYTGLKTIRTLNNYEKIKFNVFLEIKTGRVKLVLVDDKKVEILMVCDQSVSETFELQGLKGNKYKLKLVGDSSTFDLSIRFL